MARYYVHCTRIVVESQTVEVEAESENAAANAARDALPSRVLRWRIDHIKLPLVERIWPVPEVQDV